MKNSPEILNLFETAFDEGLSSDQMRQFEKALRGDQERIRFLLDYAHLQAEMYIEAKGQEAHTRSLDLFEQMSKGTNLSSTSESPEQELQVSPENIRALLEEDAEVEQRKAEERARIETLAAEKFSAFRREQNRTRRPEPVAAPRNAFYATVSSLAAAAILFILWMLPDPVPVPVIVASINDSIDASWSDPSLSMAPGTQLFTLKNLVLTRGVVQIEFEGGAKAIVEAPATLELLSPDSARLEWGRLVGHVPRSAAHHQNSECKRHRFGYRVRCRGQPTARHPSACIRRQRLGRHVRCPRKNRPTADGACRRGGLFAAEDRCHRTRARRRGRPLRKAPAISAATLFHGRRPRRR